jgi:hypothetical protein
MAHAALSTMDVGTLMLDMYDATAKQLVWTGTATKVLDPGGEQQKTLENLDRIMQKLLKYYPPK